MPRHLTSDAHEIPTVLVAMALAGDDGSNSDYLKGVDASSSESDAHEWINEISFPGI